MKGSVVVLLGCSALFFAAPSHSFSVKFISENDKVANRQDTQSGSPKPDVATAGDAVESANGDTSPGVSKTIKMDGDTKPGDESVSGDAQTEKSGIRKRDTRSLVRDIGGRPSEPASIESALNVFKEVGDKGRRCLQRALIHLQDSLVSENSYGKNVFLRSDMIKWLNIIHGFISECVRLDIEPYRNGPDPPYDDDDTPHSLLPPSSWDPASESEILKWMSEIGEALDGSLLEAIRILAGKIMNENIITGKTSQGPTDTVQRSVERVPYLLAELIDSLSKIDGGAFVVGDPVQMYPPDQFVPIDPDEIPVMTTYKNTNFPAKPRGYRRYDTLPRIMFQPLFPYGNGKEIHYTFPPHFSGFRDDPVDEPEITTLPEDVSALPNPPFSLLDLVLGIINAGLQERVPPAVNPGAESLRDDANDVLGLYRGSGNRQSLAMGGPGIRDPNLSMCVEECMNKREQ